MATSSYSLFCMGHPLLDMQVTNGEALLEKYGLNANDAILASAQHAPIYDELVREHEVTYVSGGAAQNTARGAAYLLPPGSVVFTGCVGDDELAEQLKAVNGREGLDQVYQVKKGEKTGACAVIITGHHRSLVTSLRAAEKFDVSHLSSPEVAPLIDAARVFYVEGYLLSHDVFCVLHLSQHATAAKKTFVLNLSAPYIPKLFTSQLHQVIPYCDIIIGNEAEAAAWARANNLPDPTGLPAIAKEIALLPKADTSRPRVVIFTQGAKSTVLVTSDEPDCPRVFPVNPLRDEEIVDTNAAGDAFAGGFLGAYVVGKELGECVETGHALGAMCVGQVGPQYKWPKVKIL